MKTVHNQIMILKFADFLLKRTPATLCWLKTASHLTKALSSCHVLFARLLLIMVDYQDVFCLNGSFLLFLISPLFPDWSSIATSHCWANRYTIMVAISLNVTKIWKILYGKDTLERTFFPSFIKWRLRYTHTKKVGPETTSTSSYKRNARSDFLLFYPLIGFGRFDTLLLLPGMICIYYADSVDFWSVIALRNIGNVLKMVMWQFVWSSPMIRISSRPCVWTPGLHRKVHAGTMSLGPPCCQQYKIYLTDFTQDVLTRCSQYKSIEWLADLEVAGCGNKKSLGPEFSFCCLLARWPVKSLNRPVLPEVSPKEHIPNMPVIGINEIKYT